MSLHHLCWFCVEKPQGKRFGRPMVIHDTKKNEIITLGQNNCKLINLILQLS